jgi:hypothetical protein
MVPPLQRRQQQQQQQQQYGSSSSAMAAAAAAAAAQGQPPPTLEMQDPTATGVVGGVGAVGTGLSGPPYDFSFPVEVNTGQRLTIAWNRRDDPVAVARNFLAQNAGSGLYADQVDDIVQFMSQASGQPMMQQQQQQQQAPPQQPTEPDAGLMTELMSMGFGEEAVRAALVMGGNDKQRAIEFLLG